LSARFVSKNLPGTTVPPTGLAIKLLVVVTRVCTLLGLAKLVAYIPCSPPSPNAIGVNGSPSYAYTLEAPKKIFPSVFPTDVP